MAEIGGLGNNNNPGLQIFDETPGYGTPVETLAVAPCGEDAISPAESRLLVGFINNIISKICMEYRAGDWNILTRSRRSDWLEDI